MKGAHVEMPGCERPGQFVKPEKTSIEEAEVPGGRGTGSEERRPKSSRGGANVGMPKLGHSGRIGVQGTMGAGAMGVSGQGVPTTKKGVVGAGILRGAAILSQVATLAVTGAGRGLVTKAITSMTGSGKSAEEGSSGIGGPGMDETDETGEEEEGDDEEEEVEDNDYDGQDDDEEEEQSLEVVKEREIGDGIEEEDEEVEEEEEEDEEVEEEEEEEKDEEDDLPRVS